MTKTTKRLGLMGIVLVGGVAAIAATAFAEGKGDKAGCAKNAEARFEKSDKNGDGYLTADEVGEKRWAHIKVADANADGKISLAEMKQAKADGKLKFHKGHKGHKGKGKKGGTA